MSEEKKLSVTDFKNWLEGVLDFQPEGWTPNQEQWSKILEKIGELDDTVPSIVNASEPKAPQPTQNPQPQMQPSTRHPRPEMDRSVLPPDLDEASVSLPKEPVIKRGKTMQVIQQDSPSVSDESGTRVVNTGTVYKTPENQEPSGEYDSEFI